MKLLVGLGNPGSRYRDTRHNVGFEVADELVRRWDSGFEAAPTEALMAHVRRPEGRLLIVKPLTFMNLSGGAVAEIVRYFRIDTAGMLVIADDISLPLGQLRARPRGSDGGHNGLKSIIDRLATQEFARLRVGVGRGDPRRDLADHVLARFEADERPVAAEMISRAADAAALFVTDGIEPVMNRFNARPAEVDRDD